MTTPLHRRGGRGATTVAFGLALFVAAAAQAEKPNMPTGDPADRFPAQKPPPGLGAELERMKKEADAVVARVSKVPGSAEARHRDGVFEIFSVMKPVFGPANAALFAERERKCLALAKALGLAEPYPKDLDVAALDSYFEAVRAAAAVLQAEGLRVEISPTSSGALSWSPRTPGRMMRASDPTRTVPEYVPYPELNPKAAAAQKKAVAPRLTLYLFPLARVTASLGLARREQPGHVVGAVEGALVFGLQVPQSRDSDDGKTEARVLAALFPEGTRSEDPKAAEARRAERYRGVLTVEAEGPLSTPVPAHVAAGVRAVVWNLMGPMEMSQTVAPCGR